MSHALPEAELGHPRYDNNNLKENQPATQNLPKGGTWEVYFMGFYLPSLILGLCAKASYTGREVVHPKH